MDFVLRKGGESGRGMFSSVTAEDIRKARDQIYENTKRPYLFCMPLWSRRRQQWVMLGYKQIQWLTRILAVRTGLDKEIIVIDLLVNRGRGVCP